jgi:hypothetical protein
MRGSKAKPVHRRANSSFGCNTYFKISRKIHKHLISLKNYFCLILVQIEKGLKNQILYAIRQSCPQSYPQKLCVAGRDNRHINVGPKNSLRFIIL